MIDKEKLAEALDRLAEAFDDVRHWTLKSEDTQVAESLGEARDAVEDIAVIMRGEQPPEESTPSSTSAGPST